MRLSTYDFATTAIVGNQAATGPIGTRRHSSRDGQAAEEKRAEEEQGGSRGIQGVHGSDQGDDRSVRVSSGSASRRRGGRGQGYFYSRNVIGRKAGNGLGNGVVDSTQCEGLAGRGKGDEGVWKVAIAASE